MAIQYTNILEGDFSKGIDARSAENQIGEGFVKDLLNADVIERRVRKRAGYQGYAGGLPTRVTRLDYNASTQEMCFTLDSAVSLDTAVSLETVRSSPLIVYGRTSSSATGTGPVTAADSAHYYPKFHVPLRKELVAPSGTLAIPGTEHGLGTTDIFCNVVESISAVDRSYEDVVTNAIRINETSYDIGIDYNIAVDTNAIVYFAKKTLSLGQTWTQTLSHSGGGSQVFSIPTTTHNLVNYNITMQLQQDTGTERVQVEPEAFTIDNLGNVAVSINSAFAASFRIILSAAPTANNSGGVVDATSTGTVVIPNITKPWIFYNIYLEQTPGGTKEMVEAQSVVYNDVTRELTLTFDNQAAVARNFIVFYEYGDTKSNILCVTDPLVTLSGTDLAPQITLWGLSQTEIYPTKSAREGWVNHIDSYKRSGEKRLISGLGGNIFSSQSLSEAGSQYLYAQLYPRLQARTSVNMRIGPLFWDTGDLPGRTRGYITSDISGTHWGQVSSVEYEPLSGLTKYTISLPNKQIFNSAGVPTSLTNVVTVGGNLGDYLTIQQMSYARHNGTFLIQQIQDGVDQILVWVENPNNTSDYDDLGTAGQGGILTDQITWLSAAQFLPGDELRASGLDFVGDVVEHDQSTTVVAGLTGLVQLPGGLLFSGTRTSSLIPTRLARPAASASTVNLVRGDMLSYTGIQRQLQVKYINPDIDRTCNIVAGVLTLTSGDTSYLTAGQQILLLNAGEHAGIYTIEEITSDTELTLLDAASVTAASATVVGNTIEIDENLTWSDSSGDLNILQVEDRWIPVEAPDDQFNLTPSTYVRHFDSNPYSDQPFIRSTMVADNLYLTNGDDEVMKFDGSSIYRAGILPWQPGLFITQDTAASAKIVTGLRSIAFTYISAQDQASGRVTIDQRDFQIIPEGSTVTLDGQGHVYTLRQYYADGSAHHYALMDSSIYAGVPTSGNINEVGVYKYYLRLNAVDANDNVIASAVTSPDDLNIQLTQDAAVTIKAVGLPTFANYDYDRLELQIYRTKMLTGLQAQTYYLITTLPLDFNNTQGYIEYTDTFADTNLIATDDVSVLTAGELGLGFTGPLRSKYLTSSNNRLVLANIKDYAAVDMQIVGPASLTDAEFAGDSILLRRNPFDTGTVTNMTDRVKLEWRQVGSAASVTGISGVLNTSFTVTVANTAVAGDWVYLFYSTVATTGRPLKYAGWWQIASANATTLTVKLTDADAGTITVRPDKALFASDPTNVPVPMGTDGNFGQGNGTLLPLFDSTRRMALALNAVMRQVDVTINGQSTFTPWALAKSGNDVASSGRMIIQFPQASDVIPSILPTFSGYDLYVNSLKCTSDAAVSASVAIYPSRIIASFSNYPEMFDNPTAVLDADSRSAIDINPADGQEITGIIPFFGEAAFTAAQQAAILVVFKTNSIYLVDLNQKETGGLAVQRLETQGLGCTAPYSIAVTRNGIMFANESGIYCLRKDQSIQYIGKFMERNWLQKVDRSALDLAQGHHYGTGRAYKLSVPLIEGAQDTGYQQNAEVYVYNHTQEAEGDMGAWSRYDNHPATGWANLNSDAFFASTKGVVYLIRTTGLETDFRDSNEGILFRLDTRPNGFGANGVRKVIDKIVASYRTGRETTANTLSYSVDLEQEYLATTPFRIAGTSVALTGYGDDIARDLITLRHSIARRKGVYFSIRIENGAADESVEVAGLDFRVGALDSKGIKSASQT